MSEHSRVAAAPITVKIGDKDYQLSPHTVGDLAEFDLWAEEKTLKELDERLARYGKNDALTSEQKKEMIDAVYAEIKSGMATARAAQEFSGTVKMTLLSLRHLHPEITVEQAGDAVTIVGLKQFQATLDRLSGLEEPSPNVQAAPETNPEAGQVGNQSTENSSVSSP